jgi:hypothetical protein
VPLTIFFNLFFAILLFFAYLIAEIFEEETFTFFVLFNFLDFLTGAETF